MPIKACRFMSVAALLAALVWAAPVAHVAARDAAAHAGQVLGGLHLAGGGTFRYFGLPIYDAQLWVTPSGYVTDSATAARSPFALRLTYRRDFSGVHIARTSREEMQRLGHAGPGQWQDWERTMAGLFPDVRAGDHLTGVYQPPALARFYHNDRYLGEVRDAAFARAFFAIWFDPATRAQEVREKMLSGAKRAGVP